MHKLTPPTIHLKNENQDKEIGIALTVLTIIMLSEMFVPK